MKFIRDFRKLTYPTIIALRSQYWEERIFSGRKPTTSFSANIDSHLYRKRYLIAAEEINYQAICESYLSFDFRGTVFLPIGVHLAQAKHCLNASRGFSSNMYVDLEFLNNAMKNIFNADLKQRELIYGLYIHYSAAEISKFFKTPPPAKEVQSMIKQHEKFRKSWGLPIIKKGRTSMNEYSNQRCCDLEIHIHSPNESGEPIYVYRKRQVVQRKGKVGKLPSNTWLMDFNNFYRVLGR